MLQSQSTNILYIQKHFHRGKNNTYGPKQKTTYYSFSLQVVDHLLLGNEMSGLVDQRHERVEFVRPVVEQVVGVFWPLKVDDAGHSVNLCVDGLVHNEAGEELFRFLRKYWSTRTFFQ